MEPVVYGPGTARTLFAPPKAVYVFYGEDDVQKSEALAVLRAAAVDESFADFDYEVLDADTSGAESVLAAAGLAPFGSPRRLVVLRGAEAYRKREKQAEAERLAVGLAGLGASSCLALVVGAAEDEKSRGKTILTLKLDKAVAAHGVAVRCRGLTEQGLAEWAGAQAAACGKRLAPQAAARLVAVSRGDRVVLANELDKAICYVGDAEAVSLQAVEQTASYDPEDVMFQLVDAISSRNADKALRLLRELLRYDPKPQSVAGRLLALLARQLRLLWQARELAAAGVQPGSVRNLPPALGEELPGEASIVSMAWKARDIFTQARQWSRESLTRGFEMLVECDLANKGGGEGSEDVVTNVELLIVGLCSQT